MSDGKVRGKVHFIDETKTYGQRGFRKRQVVLEQDGERFTNYIPFEFTYEGCDAVDTLNVGDEVEIEFRLSGRKWQKDPKAEVKYFLNAEAIRFQLVSDGPTSGGAPSASPTDANEALSEAAYDEEDIPF